MLLYRKILSPDVEVTKVICNKCGGKFGYQEEHPDITTIANLYGYGSQKDGVKFVSHVCEPCMDTIYATFVVPPQKSHSIVIGEDPVLPIAYDDQTG
jgi:hypothetical protein